MDYGAARLHKRSRQGDTVGGMQDLSLTVVPAGRDEPAAGGAVVANIISVLAHEVRTPLAVADGALQLLQRGDLREPDRQDNYRIIGEQLRRLNEMLVSHLDVVADRRAEIVCSPIDLRQLVLRCVADVAQLHADREFLLGADPGPLPCCADSGRLSEAVLNIVDNAAKYGRTVVAVEVLKHAETLAIRVSDDGIGVPATEIARLGEPYFRGKNTTLIRGTGLGFHHALAVVARHGGEIALGSQEGIGTVVEVRLPAVEADEPVENGDRDDG